MADSPQPIRVTTLVEHVPKREDLHRFSARMLEKCIDLELCVYVSIPIGYVACTNGYRSTFAKLTSKPSEAQSLSTLKADMDPLSGLYPDHELRFLRLDKQTLRSLITSRNATEQFFTQGGLLLSNGTERGEESSLMHASFSHAYLQPTSINFSNTERVARAPVVSGASHYKYYLNIRISDICIEDTHIGEIFSSIGGVEITPCPKEKLLALPVGIRWLYIGAQALSGTKHNTEEAELWLKMNVPDGVYSAKQVKQVGKFLQPGLSRRRGKSPDEQKLLNMGLIMDKEFISNYGQRFVSDGLKLILLAAENWLDLEDNSTRNHETLQNELAEMGFYEGPEIDVIAYLIAGPDLESKPS